MKNKTLSIIFTLMLVFIAVFSFGVSKVQAQSTKSAPALNRSNYREYKEARCSPGFDQITANNCCWNKASACKSWFPLGSIAYSDCIASKVTINGPNCEYAFTDSSTSATVTKAYRSERFGMDYVTKEFCAAEMGLLNDSGNPDPGFVCAAETFDAGFKFCLGPGGSSDKILEPGRMACCPIVDPNGTIEGNNNQKWRFGLEPKNIFVSPNKDWDKCNYAAEYQLDFKQSTANYTYNEISPSQLCDYDSKVTSRTQQKDELRIQCCQCISGKDTCPGSWIEIVDPVLKNNTWTGLGCINRSQTGLATSLMRIFFGVGLVLLLLKLIVIGFDYQSGDPEKIKEARYGILAVIVSFAVGTIGLIALRFVGLDVLGLGASTDIGTLLPTFAP